MRKQHYQKWTTAFVCSILLCFGYLLNAQTDDATETTRIIENLIEDIASQTDDEIDYTQLLADLYELHETPLDLNKATADDLARLPMLTQLNINSLLAYRQQVGQLYSIYELQAISGFSKNLIQDLQHFVTLKSKSEDNSIDLGKVAKYSQHNIMLRGQRVLESQKGYRDYQQTDFADKNQYQSWLRNRYLGNPWKYYMRYEARYKNRIRVGLVTEKDAGEEFFEGSQKKGFDHYSGFVQLQDFGRLKNLVLGDFQVQFGQGLSTWGGYTSGKSNYVLNIAKGNEGIKKYASANENNFLRGGAATVALLKGLQLSAYYSRKKIDGNVSTPEDLDEESSFSSFQISGLHRSLSELEDRKSVQESLYGLNLNYRIQQLRVGINYIDYQFDKDFVPSQTGFHQLYNFKGQTNYNLSLYGNYRYKQMFLFGEIAQDAQQSKAFLGGAVLTIHPRLSMSMLYRDYAKDYISHYSNGFGERTGTQNERGFYIASEFRPAAKWTITAYYDQFEFPWLRTGVAAPSRGNEYRIRTSYNHSRNLNAYVDLFQEKKDDNASDAATNIRYLVDEKKNKLRAHIEYKVNRQISFKNRIEITQYEKEDEKEEGFLLYHDAFFESKKWPLTFNTRYAIFSADDYDTRIYTYENDILYGFGNQSLYNRGMRFYFNTKYSPTDKLTFWIKYGITKYTNQETFGSGYNLINRNYKSELKLQLRYKF